MVKGINCIKISKIRFDINGTGHFHLLTRYEAIVPEFGGCIQCAGGSIVAVVALVVLPGHHRQGPLHRGLHRAAREREVPDVRRAYMGNPRIGNRLRVCCKVRQICLSKR